jgi:hypothetical protein
MDCNTHFVFNNEGPPLFKGQAPLANPPGATGAIGARGAVGGVVSLGVVVSAKPAFAIKELPANAKGSSKKERRLRISGVDGCMVIPPQSTRN